VIDSAAEPKLNAWTTGS